MKKEVFDFIERTIQRNGECRIAVMPELDTRDITWKDGRAIHWKQFGNSKWSKWGEDITEELTRKETPLFKYPVITAEAWERYKKTGKYPCLL